MWYQSLASNGGFLSIPEHTGLILCSDGVPVFKSSAGSLWPVYLAATSVAPEERMRMRNVILSALWHGPSKPPMDLLLRPILEAVQSLEVEGIPVPIPCGIKVLRPKLLMTYQLKTVPRIQNSITEHMAVFTAQMKVCCMVEVAFIHQSFHTLWKPQKKGESGLSRQIE